MFFKEDDTNLTESFEMVSVVFHNIIEMLQSFLIVLILVVNLAKTEVGWDTGGVEFQTVFEVFLPFLKVALVCQLSSQMNRCSEMRLVKDKTLFEELNSLFYVLFLL
jgi:hypothetical protein